MNNFPDIIGLIPQRHPFVMVDQVIKADENSCTTRFYINAGNLLLENETFTEAGLVENIAQTAAAHAGLMALKANTAVRTGFIGAVTNLEIDRLPFLDDELETSIKIENQIFDVTLISGEVSCCSKIIARCEMKIFLLPDVKKPEQ